MDGIMRLKAFLLERKKTEERMTIISVVSKGAISAFCFVSLQKKKTTVMVLFEHLLHKMCNIIILSHFKLGKNCIISVFIVGLNYLLVSEIMMFLFLFFLFFWLKGSFSLYFY